MIQDRAPSQNEDRGGIDQNQDRSSKRVYDSAFPSKRRLFALALLSALLGACSTSHGPATELEKIMATLGPSPLFAGLQSGRNWLIVGNPSKDKVTLAKDEGLPVVAFHAGEDDLILGRQVRQHLLATPFLTWNWKMSPHAGVYHPVRLLVGFNEQRPDPSARNQALDDLPNDVRLLELVWNARALRRGVMDRTNSENNPIRYTVRGGEEALGKRWAEGVDLIALHDQAWPGLSTWDTRVVFIAARTTSWRAKGKAPGALISEIRLIK